MKKSNKILIGILVFILTCFIGYALFSENITITGTATAQGDFEIVSSCQTGVPSAFLSSVETIIEGTLNENGYKDDFCSFNGNKGTFSVAFEYPGAYRIFVVKFTNKGNITATFGKVKREFIEYCLGGVCKDGEPTSSTPGVANRMILFAKTPEIIGIQIGSGNLIGYDDINQVQANEFLDSNGNYILKPGNSVFYAVASAVNQEIGFNTPGTLDLSNKVNYIFEFEQVVE